MSSPILFLKLEPYLAQWFVHENGDVQPIHLPRGSSEADILERFIAARAIEDRVDEIAPEDANVAIYIPSFKGRDNKFYNYMPRHGRHALERNIYVRFRVQMWEELHSLDNVDCPIGDLIWAWMEKHGIADDPKNWETIRQMYYRKRKSHQKKADEIVQ